MQPMGFRATNLEPPSQAVYHSLNSKHMSGEKLMGHMDTAGNQLMQQVQGKFISLKGNMTYNEFIAGLVFKGENILSAEPHLRFQSLLVTDEFGVLKETKVGGIALLTDQRLLLLSSQYFQSSTLVEFGDAKKLPGGYTMEMSCKDNTYYTPINLSLFRSIEMEGGTGVSGSISVHATPPPFKGYLGCCGCLKGWKSMPMVYSEFNQMSVRFGVLMPPWQHKSFLTLHLGQDVSTQYLKDFVASFQGVARSTFA